MDLGKRLFCACSSCAHSWSTCITQTSTILTRATNGASSSPRMSMAAPVDVSGDGGVTRVVRRKGTGKPVGPGDIAVLKYSGKIIDTGLVFTRSDEYRCTLNDGTMISGWDAGLGGLNVGDEATIRCSPRYGYGDEGVPPVVPPGATLEFDVQVLENEGNIMNPNTFADTNPLTPRTPDSIRTEFLRKQEAAAAAMGPEAEGFAKVLQWFKSIYVFGLFEGQTGEEAPWYLRPLITFPIMFAISGAAFLVVYALNGISTNRSPGGVADDIEVASTVAAVLAAALGDAFHA
ncbi:unnamed protein product [Phaeothamnion confervicola]